MLLAGTPVQNNMKEVQGVLSMLDTRQFGKLEDFTKKYGGDDEPPTVAQIQALQVQSCCTWCTSACWCDLWLCGSIRRMIWNMHSYAAASEGNTSGKMLAVLTGCLACMAVAQACMKYGQVSCMLDLSQSLVNLLITSPLELQNAKKDMVPCSKPCSPSSCAG